MGILVTRHDDPDLYREAYEEAQRIIRISDEVRMSLEKVAKEETEEDNSSGEKLTTSKLAQKLGMKTNELLEKLVKLGYLETRNGSKYITNKGKEVGGEFRMSQKFGPYFLWPEDIQLEPTSLSK